MAFWLTEIFRKPISAWTWIDIGAVAVGLLFVGVLVLAVYVFRSIARSDDKNRLE
jgi:hypothetical protein